MQTLKYEIGKAVGMILIVFGGIFLLTMVINVSNGKSTILEGLLGGLVLGCLPGVGGFFMWKSARKNARKFLMEKYERQILNLAAENEGHLTPTELALKTNLSLKESKKVLETMHLESLAELKISDNGVIVFYFRELDKTNNGESQKVID